MNRMYVAFVVAVTLAVTGLLLSSAAISAQGTTQPAKMLVVGAESGEHSIPSVLGPSWLKHLGLTVSQTHLGQMGGDASPSGKPEVATTAHLKPLMQRFLATVRSDPDRASGILSEQFQVSGADLYRWNCRGCHGPEGKGADPDINSVIGPVQATSPIMKRQSMAARGIEADDDMINQLSEMAATSLQDRLQHGGKNMPSFDYLRNDEVDALLGYLEKLAGVPPTKRDGLVVSESAGRVGELITRGTCHICHDATGPGDGMGQWNIPSLASIPRDHSLSGIVHQVQYGSSSAMKLTGGEVMPAYPYFTEEEITAVYFVAFSRR